MKKFFNKKILFIAIISFAILLIQNNVYATGGQASGISNTLYSKTVSYFFELIRAMETSTGTLGVDSNIDTSTVGKYVDNAVNGEINNIDCHLQKNTEYGTVTLLAASDFGNAISTDSESTANDGTGVYQMSNGKYEYSSAVFQTSVENTSFLSVTNNGALISADSRYVDTYVGQTKQSNVGDGIIETDSWKNSIARWRY